MHIPPTKDAENWPRAVGSGRIAAAHCQTGFPALDAVRMVLPAISLCTALTEAGQLTDLNAPHTEARAGGECYAAWANGGPSSSEGSAAVGVLI